MKQAFFVVKRVQQTISLNSTTKTIVLLSWLTCIQTLLSAQTGNQIVSGPMTGHTELRTAKLWIQFNATVQQAAVSYYDKAKKGKIQTVRMMLNGGEFNTATVTLTGLEPGRTYAYDIKIGSSNSVVSSGTVTTQPLWQWRTDPPAFSFITGSCAYFNEPEYDRPGPAYGSDSSIFETMAKDKAAFTLWLGDNWYTREADYFSEWGLHKRASRDRSMAVLQPLLKAMPQYAIWDDHDYGPNDAGKSYELKNTSRDIFKKYWANPSYGTNQEAIYSKFTWNDVDFFLLDDRWYRSNDGLPDSVNGQPNADKKMFGDAQMEWLKNALMVSNGNANISFRIIATGSQVLNPLSPYDCFRHFPAEYTDLMKFIDEQNIKGLVFVTGDRHHSEIIRRERTNNYPLYDITVSPLTSGVAKTSGIESTNPARVQPEIDVQNYGRFSFSGAKTERKMTVEFTGLKGEKLGNWSVLLKDLVR